MKVLHIITGLNDGGAEAVLYRLCKFDQENEHIVISLMDQGKYGPLLEEEGVKVFTLEMPAGKIKIRSLFGLYKLIKHMKPDVIQTWMFHADLIGGIIGRIAGIKNIVWGVHHTTLVKGESKSSTILIAKLNAILSKIIPKKIIYCADKSREVQESIGFQKSKGFVVYNGYSIDDFVPNTSYQQKFRNELGIMENEMLIGHVGRYDPQKDHHNLIDAIALLKPQQDLYKAVLVGTNLDEHNDQLVSYIKGKGLQDKFILLGRRNDIPVVMNGFDVFVLSSAFGEAFPNVLNESMACGTPCIATNVGDASVIVGNTGWIVAPKNPLALADALSSAIDEKLNFQTAWQERQKCARKRIVENFSIQKMVSGYTQVWNI